METWLTTWLTLGDEVKLPVKMYWIPCPFVSPRARESKTVLDSGFHAVDSGFQVLDSSLFLIGTFLNFFYYYFISFVIGSWILDSNRKWESGFLEMVFRGPVTRKMVKFNPGVSQILSKVKNMSLELTKYCCVFPPRSSDDYVECYSKQCIGR